MNTSPAARILLNGLVFREAKDLAGLRKAFKYNGLIHVSPAVWSLLRYSTPAELNHLLANLPLLDLYAISAAIETGHSS